MNSLGYNIFLILLTGIGIFLISIIPLWLVLIFLTDLDSNLREKKNFMAGFIQPLGMLALLILVAILFSFAIKEFKNKKYDQQKDSLSSDSAVAKPE